MKLYEITEAYNSLLDADLDEEAIEQSLKVIDDEFDTKIENTVKVIKNAEADIKALREEEKRLASKRRTLESKIDYLKKNIFVSMQTVNSRKIETPLFNVAIQKNPKKLIVKSERNVPDEFIKVSKSIDKAKLKEAIEDGLSVDYAELVQEEGLRIR